MTTKLLSENQFGSVRIRQQSSDCEIVEINHQLAKASFSLYGGQVLTWQPKAQRPVFWLSKASEYGHGTAIRGGIPICWPWFGAYNDAGNHGFVRNAVWQLIDVVISASNVQVVIELQGENDHILWPYAYRLQQVLTFSERFEQTFIIENHSNEAVRFSNALHSYFQISTPSEVVIPNIQTSMFDDKIAQVNGAIDQLTNCVGPIDRIYYNNQPQQIIDNGWQRQINVQSFGCEQWVLWNPGKEIASNMHDIHQRGEDEYVCLEAANTGWVNIAAHQKVTLGQMVTLLDL